MTSSKTEGNLQQNKHITKKLNPRKPNIWQLEVIHSNHFAIKGSSLFIVSKCNVQKTRNGGLLIPLFSVILHSRLVLADILNDWAG